MIRIIAGIYKGRFLKIPNSKVTRPTMDKVRQAIFSAMKDKAVHALALDLFAGSGAMGIEALSRGAKKAYLNDKDHQTFRLMVGNLKDLDIPSDQYEVSNMDYRLFLKKHRDVQFDLVFLDPPYRFTINQEIIEEMQKQNQLAKGALIVSEQDYPNPDIPGFTKREYRYGEKYAALYDKGDTE